jgi:glutaredoxin
MLLGPILSSKCPAVGAPKPMTTVTLYTQPDCHLCDEARAVLEEVRKDFPFDLEQVDIRRDRELRARYGVRIPVVTVDGVEHFELRVDDQELRSILAGSIESGRENAPESIEA